MNAIKERQLLHEIERERAQDVLVGRQTLHYSMSVIDSWEED